MSVQQPSSQLELSVTVSLKNACLKTGHVMSTVEVEAVQETVALLEDLPPRRIEVLWVDDRPANNRFEREAFEAMGVDFTLAVSTEEALIRLAGQSFAAIISDMSRPEGRDAGHVLLARVRESGDDTPYFIYAASSEPHEVEATLRRGGQGCTDSPADLFRMVMPALAA